MPTDYHRDALLRLLTTRKVFISYHHHGDRAYYEFLSSLISNEYEVVEDNSVEREIDSDDAEYVIRCIREQYITGTSCTIVLCGADTPGRKFVDWEIKASLDAGHSLIAVRLPTARTDTSGRVHVPARLHDNLASGFAQWMDSHELFGTNSTVALKIAIEHANLRSRNLIDNTRPLRRRNG